MNADFSYDPVTAADETAATGKVAAIFQDIRSTMDLPLLTSIWRALADMGDSLDCVWDLTKPIFLSGLPEQALETCLSQVILPVPQPLAPTQLECMGIDAGHRADIRAILAAYNRSNGMNLLALAALMTPDEMLRRTQPLQPATGNGRAPHHWPPLRPLLAREVISPAVWSLIRHVNRFGAPGLESHVATLWRHLAHWPAVLSLLHTGLAPLHAAGAIHAASGNLTALALAHGAGMAHLRSRQFDIPPAARAALHGYVNTPSQVARMVVLGNVVARWLDDAPVTGASSI